MPKAVSESGTPYSIVNDGGVWYITPDTNPTGGAYNLKLYFNNFSGLTDNSFGIPDRPFASSDASDWIVPAGSSLPEYLGKVDAAGNSASILEYRFTDSNPLSRLNFYQLKMVDIDSRFQMSPVVEVDFEDPVSFTVYPNPVTNNEFFVQHDGVKVNWLKLFSIDGRQVYCGISELSAVQIRVSLQSASTKGTYIVQVGTDKGIKTTMILIQ